MNDEDLLEIQDLNLNGPDEPTILKEQLYTRRNGQKNPDKKTEVYVTFEDDRVRVVGLKRES